MTIHELIKDTRSKAQIIKKEHKILVEFQRENPHLIEAILNEMRLQVAKSPNPLPTFDSLLTFKKDFLVDSMTKVYRQIKSTKGQSCMVCFYRVVPEFYQEQQHKGYKLGEVDNLGYIVTGSNLVIETSTVQRDDFLYQYYATNN